MADNTGMYVGWFGIRGHSTADLGRDSRYGYTRKNNFGTGLCNGNELSGDSIVPVHYRLLSDLVPH